MTPPNPLTELADRVQALTIACRETDLAIHLVLWPDDDLAKMTQNRRGLDSQEGYAWTISGASVVYERWTADGRCPHNGGYPLPAYTSSLDAAMTLVPEGWFWTLCQQPVSARIWTEGNVAYSVPTGQTDIRPATPIFALLVAILRARAALENSHGT